MLSLYPGSASSWTTGAGNQDGVGTVFQPLYTALDLSRLLQLPRKRVYELGIPEVRPAPRTIRYLPSDVSSWLEARRRDGT